MIFKFSTKLLLEQHSFVLTQLFFRSLKKWGLVGPQKLFKFLAHFWNPLHLCFKGRIEPLPDEWNQYLQNPLHLIGMKKVVSCWKNFYLVFHDTINLPYSASQAKHSFVIITFPFFDWWFMGCLKEIKKNDDSGMYVRYPVKISVGVGHEITYASRVSLL